MLTQERLKSVLDYNPETGVFVWKEWRGGTAYAGTVAGRTSNGYVGISVDRRRYPAHRLAWLYVTGGWPVDEIDHINGSKADNRWANLRQADRVLNNQNRRVAHRGSEVNFLGVARVSNGTKFRAAIRTNGKLRHLGTFATPEQAHAVYLDAKRREHAGCTI